MKKIIALVLSLGMALSLVACGGGETPAENTEAPAETTEAPAETSEEPAEDTTDEPAVEDETQGDTQEEAPAVEGKNPADMKVGVCIYKFDDNFMTLYRTEIEKYLNSLGCTNVSVMDGKGDQAEQTNQINNFIAEGVDLLIVNLVQSTSAETVANLCHDAKIPVVFINRDPAQEEMDRWATEGIQACFTGIDVAQAGVMQGEAVLSLPNKGDLNGDGTVSYVMLIGDPENPDAQARTEWSVKTIEASGMQVKELFAQRGDWMQDKGQELTANALTQFGDEVEVVLANNDAMGLGAKVAIEAAGRKINEDIYLFGVDALEEVLLMVQDGTFSGTVFNDHITQAHDAVDYGMKMVNGETVPTSYYCQYKAVTKDNAAEILALIKG